MTATPTAIRLVHALIREGMTHLVGLPDNASAALFSQVGQRSDVSLLPVTREGEAFAVAAGIWLGGGNAVVCVQNSGMLESGDSIRGTAMRMGAPILCLVTYRGYAGMAGSGIDPFAADRSAEELQDNHLDSAALLTEPTLRAWGIPYELYSSDEDLPLVAQSWSRAHRERRPTSLLITRPLS